MIRFHLDQHVDSAIARGLLIRGIDVTTTSGAGLQDAEDQEHIAFALRERRVIFTQDSDFLRKNSERVTHNGIVYCHQGTRTIGEVVRFLELVSQTLELEDMIGKVEFC